MTKITSDTIDYFRVRHFSAVISVTVPGTNRSVFSHVMRDESPDNLKDRIAALPANFTAARIAEIPALEHR